MYNNDERALIWLNNFNISAKKKYLIYNLFQEPSEIVKEFKNCKDEILEIIDIATYNKMALLLDDSFTDKLINDLMIKGVGALTLISDNYPKKLEDYFKIL